MPKAASAGMTSSCQRPARLSQSVELDTKLLASSPGTHICNSISKSDVPDMDSAVPATSCTREPVTRTKAPNALANEMATAAGSARSPSPVGRASMTSPAASATSSMAPSSWCKAPAALATATTVRSPGKYRAADMSDDQALFAAATCAGEAVGMRFDRKSTGRPSLASFKSLKAETKPMAAAWASRNTTSSSNTV